MKLETLKERRNLTCEVRASKVMDADGVTLEGYASVFNTETDIAGMFREVVKPGAFARAIKEKHDVRALINHDSNLVLGRTSAGTVGISEDDHGLAVACALPETQYARDLEALIKRGDVGEMSFGFIVTGEEWTQEKGKLDLRSITDVTLLDVSVVTFPQYAETEVGLRSADAVYNDRLKTIDGHEPAEGDEASVGHEPAALLRRVEIETLRS